MNEITNMYSFSSRLWYDKRWISKSGLTSISLQVILNGKHKEFPLKLKWPINFIDVVKGILLPRFKGDSDVDDFNLIIEVERTKHIDIFKNYRIRKEDLDFVKFSREIRVFSTNECFLTYMELESNRRYRRKEILRKTFQNANATRAIIKEYDPECLFKNINLKWMKGFRLFLMNKGYKPSTIWSRLSYIKAYLHLASLEPMLYVNPEVINFPNPKPEYQTTFLNNEELRRLMILHRDRVLEDLPHRVLSAFLFTCFTSLRISDLYRVNAKWQISANVLKFIPKKNERKGKVLEIEIMPLANTFIHHVTGLYFELPSEQEYNRTLKDIAIKAEINKKLSSHVGRHTFGYLYMTIIGNQKGLQEILGHSKPETTDRYSHLDKEYQRTAVKRIQDQFSDLILRKIN